MLRLLKPADTETVIELTAGTGFFKPHELVTLREVIDDYHVEDFRNGHRAFVWEEAGRLLGYVYHAPAPMTDRTWYLYWIAVVTDQQGRGLGGKMLQFVEKDVRDLHGRLLLVETSTTPHYALTRRFYVKHGYDLIATLPDYYSDGDGMAVFCKRINSPAG